VSSIARKLLFQRSWWIFYLIAVTFFIYTFISWQKHYHFQTFGWDTSVFDQQIYLASKLQSPYSSLNQINGLADHFHPILLFIGAILYYFLPDPRLLFALQALIVSLSGLPVYLTVKYLLKKSSISDRGIDILSLSISVMYLFSVATQAMTLDEIHDDVLATLPVLSMMYFLIRHKYVNFWFSFIALLLIKEEYGLLGLALAIIVLITTKKFKLGFFTLVVGIGTFYFLLFKIMPLLGTGAYFHFRAGNYPTTVVKTFITYPTHLITYLFNHPQKRLTWTTSLISFGFLPLLSPINLILPLYSLAIRFYDVTTPRRYEFNNHYASPFIPFWALAAAVGLVNLLFYAISIRKINPKRVWITTAVLIILITIAQDVIFHGPVNSLFKKSFYQTQAWENDAHELITHVPTNVSLATQNSLLPYLSQRENFYLLPEIKDAGYIAVDLTDGPNKFGAFNVEQIKIVIEQLINQKKFKIVWQKNQALLLKKIDR